MVVAGPEGFQKNQYRMFNIRASDLVPGDDFGMMREVLTRRFQRLVNEAPRPSVAAPSYSHQAVASALALDAVTIDVADPADAESPWPGLVVIDGGRGQL